MAAPKTPEPVLLEVQSRDELPTLPFTETEATRQQRAQSLAPPSFIVADSPQETQCLAFTHDDVTMDVLPSSSGSISDDCTSQASSESFDGRRSRCYSLPLLPVASKSVEALTSERAASVPAPMLSPQPKLPPLSYHHIIALHQLNLPRLPNQRIANQQATGLAQLVLPSIDPPITHDSLRELDLIEVMRNPQLRHDVVFDHHLTFRPNLDGDRGLQKREAADRYWKAVSAEIEHGCRCAAWEVGSSTALPCVCASASTSFSAVEALVHGGRQRAEYARRTRALHQANAPALASRLPSRIPALVEQLRCIFTSLLPATTSVTLAQEISAVLDAELIAQQAEHGILDVVALANFLGSTLKLHCAPMRDAAVDRMVAAVHQSQVALGLRWCFELLEQMKLDIANHQLRSLRPFLLETATDFELKHLYDTQQKSQDPRNAFDRTRRWFFESMARIRDRDIVHVLSDGLLELAFRPNSVGLPSSQLTAAPLASQLPETLHLDVIRLQGFHADVTDVTIVCMLLLLYRQLCSSTAGRPQPSSEELDAVRRELWVLISQAVTVRQSDGPSASPSGQTGMAFAGQSKLHNAEWRRCLGDAALQIAKRVNGRVSPRPDEQDLVIGWLEKHLTPTSDLYQMVQSRLRSALAELLEQRGHAILHDNISLLGMATASYLPVEAPVDVPVGCVRRPASLKSEQMASSRSSSSNRSSKRRRSDDEDNSSPASKRQRTDASSPDPTACLAPLMLEVRTLSERIAKVAAVHLRVYSGWYAALLSGGLPPTLVIHSASTSSANSEVSE